MPRVGSSVLRRAARGVLLQVQPGPAAAVAQVSAPGDHVAGICSCTSCAADGRRTVVTATGPHIPGVCACAGCRHAARRTMVSAAGAADELPDYSNVPLGHLKSDLSSTACNIGLNRRRDLSLRHDLTLSTLKGEQHSLQHWLTGKTVVVFGIPDGSSVCIGTHISGFEKLAGELKQCGIDEVLCVMVGSPAEVQAVADKASTCMLTWASDTNGGFTRMLGLDLAGPTESGPRSQRYSGIIENGILTKLKVEKNLGEVTGSGCERILELLQCKRDQRAKFAS